MYFHELDQVHESFVWGQDPDQWTWSSSVRIKRTLCVRHIPRSNFDITVLHLWSHKLHYTKWNSIAVLTMDHFRAISPWLILGCTVWLPLRDNYLLIVNYVENRMRGRHPFPKINHSPSSQSLDWFIMVGSGDLNACRTICGR